MPRKNLRYEIAVHVAIVVVVVFVVIAKERSISTIAYTLCHLTFRHRASAVGDRSFATLQSMLFIYLINKYISLSGICLTLHR